MTCVFETIGVHTARWIYWERRTKLAEFRTKAYDHLAIDHSGALVYLAPSRVNLDLTIERWPELPVPGDPRAPGGCRVKRTLLRRPIIGWALYDWANSAFATTVMAGFFPVFFQQFWSVGTEASVSTFRLGVVSGLGEPGASRCWRRSSARWRTAAAYAVRLLVFFTRARRGHDGGALLGRAGRVGRWPPSSSCSRAIGFNGGIVFNDALLLDVAEPPEFDRVSAFGYSLGYLGGGLLLLVNVVMVCEAGGFRPVRTRRRPCACAFPTVAVWWLLFTMPLLRCVREQQPARALPARDAPARRLARAPRDAARDPRSTAPLVWFLLAYWLYIDGVNTIIKMAVDYGLSLGFPQQSLIAALLIVQFVGFPAALVFGWLGDRIGARKRGILIGARGLCRGITVYAYFLIREARVLRAGRHDRASCRAACRACRARCSAAGAGRQEAASSSASTT